jgi:hypothetical protein
MWWWVMGDKQNFSRLHNAQLPRDCGDWKNGDPQLPHGGTIPVNGVPHIRDLLKRLYMGIWTSSMMNAEDFVA